MAERAEPETADVTVKVSRATYEQLRSLAARWGTSVEVALARLARDALRASGTAPAAADALSAEGLSTDGLDPDEDAYWRELHDLTRAQGEPEERAGSARTEANAEAKPGRAPAR
jgi:hypothetical protein